MPARFRRPPSPATVTAMGPECGFSILHTAAAL
jgi:hypothetical protein